MYHAVTTQLFGRNVAIQDDRSHTKRDSPSGPVTLSALEASLASATAVTMWSAARGSTLQLTQIIDTGTSPTHDGLLPVLPSTNVAFSAVVEPRNGSAHVTQHILVGHIMVSRF